MKARTLLWLGLFFASAPPPAAATLNEVREVHYQMGTYFDVTLWHSEPQTARRLIREAVREVHRLEEILSNYDPQSALSRLNRKAGQGNVRVTAELFELLATAREFSEKTAGTFDVTVGPLMELWRRAAEQNRLPNPELLGRALAAVGYRNLVLSRPDQAALARTGMSIDLGGIGKGYAVDRAAAMFKAAGISAALISFGGSSLSALGAPPRKTGWEIAVQDSDGRLRGTLRLRDLALSTSSSTGRWWIIGGKKYGHLINPMTGAPMTEARTAVVVARSATEAEALTKPLVLLGKSGFATIAHFPQVAGIILSAQGVSLASPNFSSLSSWKEIS